MELCFLQPTQITSTFPSIFLLLGRSFLWGWFRWRFRSFRSVRIWKYCIQVNEHKKSLIVKNATLLLGCWFRFFFIFATFFPAILLLLGSFSFLVWFFFCQRFLRLCDFFLSRFCVDFFYSRLFLCRLVTIIRVLKKQSL